MKHADYSKLAKAAGIKGGCGHSDAETAETGSLFGLCLIALPAVIAIFSFERPAPFIGAGILNGIVFYALAAYMLNIADGRAEKGGKDE